MKKTITIIIISILIIGTLIVCIKGFNVGLIYRKSISFDIYIGEKIEDKDIKEIAKEVFKGNSYIIQKVELYEDMVSITTKEMSNEKIEETKELLVNKVNEKYGTEFESDYVQVRNNPKTRISDIGKKYIVPYTTVTLLILIYQTIRFRKLGSLKTVGTTVGLIIIAELVYLSLLAITRLPFCRLTIPFGILIFIGVVIGINIYNEHKLETIK